MKTIFLTLLLAFSAFATPAKTRTPLMTDYHMEEGHLVATLISDSAILEWNSGKLINLEKIVLNGKVVCSKVDGMNCEFVPQLKGLNYKIGQEPLTANDEIIVVVSFQDEFNSDVTITKTFVKTRGFEFGQGLRI